MLKYTKTLFDIKLQQESQYQSNSQQYTKTLFDIKLQRIILVYFGLCIKYLPTFNCRALKPVAVSIIISIYINFLILIPLYL